MLCVVQEHLGIPVSLGPKVVLSPSFASNLRSVDWASTPASTVL
jgi:hypothetical protein